MALFSFGAYVFNSDASKSHDLASIDLTTLDTAQKKAHGQLSLETAETMIKITDPNGEAIRHTYMQVMTILLVVCITFTFLWLIRMRQLLQRGAKALDKGITTPSDFCLMGRHMQFEQYDPASIKKEIEEELKERYNISEVVYVNPVYDIADYYRVVASQHETMKLKLLADAHMKAYMEEHSCDKAAYVEVINNPEECPKDAPKRGGLCSKRSCDPTEID